MMPVSMVIGILFYPTLSKLGFLMPYLIFGMLFITYTNLSLRDIRFTRMHAILLTIQLAGSIGVYYVLHFYDIVVAQGAMICILAPTATSAVVITSMLGGNIASLTAYSLLCNIAVAISAPIIFSIIGGNSNIPFWNEVWQIAQRVFVLLVLPFILSILISKVSPLAHRKIRRVQPLSFYLWNMALITATARMVQFLAQEGSTHFTTALLISLSALIICILQFYLGRKIGRKYNDTIAGGQGLGQKNTILSIWMAQTYLNPISSIGPGTYILWQNIINSYQVWAKQNAERKQLNEINK